MMDEVYIQPALDSATDDNMVSRSEQGLVPDDDNGSRRSTKRNRREREMSKATTNKTRPLVYLDYAAHSAIKNHPAVPSNPLALRRQRRSVVFGKTGCFSLGQRVLQKQTKQNPKDQV